MVWGGGFATGCMARLFCFGSLIVLPPQGRANIHTGSGYSGHRYERTLARQEHLRGRKARRRMRWRTKMLLRTCGAYRLRVYHANNGRSQSNTNQAGVCYTRCATQLQRCYSLDARAETVDEANRVPRGTIHVTNPSANSRWPVCKGT